MMICPLCSKSYEKWKAFREHLVDPKRKHKPEYYDRCGICGDLFWTHDDWITHTAARRCQKPRGGFSELTHLTQRQADDIKRLQSKGTKSNQSNEQLARAVWKIVRHDEAFPAYQDAWRRNFLPALRSTSFQEMASDLPEVQHLSTKEARVKAVIQICSKVDIWLTRCPDLVNVRRGQSSVTENPRPSILQPSTSSVLRTPGHRLSEPMVSYPDGINDSLDILSSSSSFHSGQSQRSQAGPLSPTSWSQPSSLLWSRAAFAEPQNVEFDMQFIDPAMLENSVYPQLLGNLSFNARQ